MTALARLAASLLAWTAPLVSFAQEAGGRAPGPRAGYSWLWILVGAAVVVALFRLLVVRNRGGRGPTPPARLP